jgi:hypothetical protein
LPYMIGNARGITARLVFYNRFAVRSVQGTNSPAEIIGVKDENRLSFSCQCCCTFH